MTMYSRVLVCGGRKFWDTSKLNHIMDGVFESHHFTVLIHGDARGADRMAGRWAEEHGDIEVIRFPIYGSDWRKYGYSAGPRRNARMLEHGKPDLVIAFPGGNGTANMVGLARAEGVLTREITA